MSGISILLTLAAQQSCLHPLNRGPTRWRTSRPDVSQLICCTTVQRVERSTPNKRKLQHNAYSCLNGPQHIASSATTQNTYRNWSPVGVVTSRGSPYHSVSRNNQRRAVQYPDHSVTGCPAITPRCGKHSYAYTLEVWQPLSCGSGCLVDKCHFHQLL